MRILCSLVCSSVSDVCLSLLYCWTAALSSVVLAARLALSLILLRTSTQSTIKSTRGNEMLQIVKLEHANREYTGMYRKCAR